MKPQLLSVRYRIHAISVTVLVALITGCCLWARSSGVTLVLQIVTPMLAIALAFILLSIPGKMVRNEKVLFISFLVLLILGIVTYHLTGADDCHFTDAKWYIKLILPVLNTLSVFFPSRGAYYPDETSRVLFWIFHFLSYFYFAWVGLALLGKKLLNRASLLLIPSSRQNVIWGYSDVGFELAWDILRNNNTNEEPVFVVDSDTSCDEGVTKGIFNKLCNANILTVIEDIAGGNNHIYGHRHYFITENQDDNVNMAFMVIEKISELRWYEGRRTHIFVRCELEGIDALFQEKLQTAGDRVEIHIFSQSDLTARQFITKHPTLELANLPDLTGAGSCLKINHDTLQVSGCAHILLLGLGWTGYELLRKIVCDTRYLGDAEIKITVIDDNFKDSNGRFAPIFAEADRHGIYIEVNPAFPNRNTNDGEEKRVHKVGSARFYNWLGEHAKILEFNRIIVALGDDELNTNTALDIHRFRAGYLTPESAKKESNRMPEKIYAYVRDKKRYTYYESCNSPIIPFGGIRDIYTYDILVNESPDTVAKMVNYVYCRYDVLQVSEEELEEQLAAKDSLMEQEWSGTSIFNQDSSRAVALNIPNMVTICGGRQGLDRCIKDPHYINHLAEMEHLRWNAFHIMKGIKPWPIEEVCELNGKKNGKLLIYNALFKHICLVPYDRLDEASIRINILQGKKSEDYKEVDRRTVRHFSIFAKHI